MFIYIQRFPVKFRCILGPNTLETRSMWWILTQDDRELSTAGDLLITPPSYNIISYMSYEIYDAVSV